jgi:hypothetical protein
MVMKSVGFGGEVQGLAFRLHFWHCKAFSLMVFEQIIA